MSAVTSEAWQGVYMWEGQQGTNATSFVKHILFSRPRVLDASNADQPRDMMGAGST